MPKPKFAVLAPEIPSPSATFVYREVLALREAGCDVLTYSLRTSDTGEVSADGQPFFAETLCLYGRPWLRTAFSAIALLLRSPVGVLRSSSCFLRDLLFGEFPSFSKRLKLVFQFVHGLGLGWDLKKSGVAHLHIQFCHSVANVGMYGALAASADFSVTAHANDIFVEPSLVRQKVNRAALFRTISYANRRHLIETYNIEPSKVEVIRCGVDLAKLKLTEDERSDRKLLFAGRLVAKKGCEFLLRALANLKPEFPNLTLDVVGDGPLRGELESLTNRIGLESCVKFHGHLGEARLRTRMRDSTALVLPCRTAKSGDKDGIPVVLMEAMAQGLPVVVSQVDGIEEIVSDELSGVLVEPEDVEHLTESIAELLRDDDYRKQLARHGRRVVERKFDVRKQVRSLADRISWPTSRTSNSPSKLGAAVAKVVIVTPFRDEFDHLPRIIACVKAQTLRPHKWIMVDDGSSDQGAEIARALTKDDGWIEVVHREDRGERLLGAGVIDAFNEGFEQLSEDWDFVAKMDADLSFSPCYLETAIGILLRERRLACLSGKVFRPESGGPTEEGMIDEMVAGQFKLYRREAFKDIGGFVPFIMWDGIDFHRCRQEGWLTRSDRHPLLRIVHHRLMGSSDISIFRGRLRLGRGQWFMGTHPLYLAASAARRMLEKPYVVGGLLMIVGYLWAGIKRHARFDDEHFKNDLRGWQKSRILDLVLGGSRS